MRIAIATCVLATLLLVALILYFPYRRVEGFATEPNRGKSKHKRDSKRSANVDNALLALVGQLKHMMGYVSNPADWIERIQIMNLTPAELARRHLKATAKATVAATATTATAATAATAAAE